MGESNRKRLPAEMKKTPHILSASHSGTFISYALNKMAIMALLIATTNARPWISLIYSSTDDGISIMITSCFLKKPIANSSSYSVLCQCCDAERFCVRCFIRLKTDVHF